MNRELEQERALLAMAREAGLSIKEPQWGYTETHHVAGWLDNLKRFEALIRADEREACAKVCDEYDVADDVNSCDTAEGISLAIRARGNK